VSYTFFRNSCSLRDNHNEYGRDREAYEVFHDLHTTGRHIDAVCMPNNDRKIHTYGLIWNQKYENREIYLRISSYYDICILIVRKCAIGHERVKGLLFSCFVAIL